MAINYDLVGSDYSMTSGKGTTSSFNTGSAYKNIVSSIANNRTTVKVADYKPTTTVGQVIAGSSSAKSSSKSSSSGSGGYSGSSGGGSISYSVPQPVSYIDAPFAEAYGMNAATAYQEALSNNAVRRRVNDLKAAGLNPVLGVSGSGATSFYGTPLEIASGGASSFGGVSYGSSGSGKDTSKLASIGNQLIRNLPNLVGGIVTIATRGNVGKGYGAQQVAQGISNIFRYS